MRHAYGTRSILEDVSFTAARGEIVGLLGPNGSGKSTALALLAGLLPWKSGTLAYAGETLLPSHRHFRRNIGVVFQQPSLDQKLSARENLGLSLQMQGISGARLRERVRECLDFAELADRADDPVRNFSGGMRRRLDLARAIAHRPALLLLDEPSAGLDEASFRRLWQAISQLRREEGIAVVVATHRPDEAANCSRLIVLHQGRVLRDASPNVLIDEQASDVLTIELQDASAANLSLVRDEIRQAIGVESSVLGDTIQVACERGHELLVKIVEKTPAGMLRSLTLARPSLADVFFRITGNALQDQVQGDPAATKGKKS
jgi:ABC-2 type transport system ATP-binding protein